MRLDKEVKTDESQWVFFFNCIIQNNKKLQLCAFVDTSVRKINLFIHQAAIWKLSMN